ncbi:crosslink repair DNA glycosylase YcaQ family protein [Microbacterium betulae]|uniref:Crosslink repair DNA glycosylase YcaQ family protein n=1 Tax=Microbacterium betulae TaxID=2981139 RepID=A0AA97FLQ7_9MICO|nr:crosslink repair DNA glycosylase YcaQ family protein [Microbacterium sp. AB]WOF24369.1 crosslink repair DNA glycosylase YcaQ family protein [Microbacterium sp. AB]
MKDVLSASEARRVALAAQGFARPRPAAPGPRHLRGELARMGVLQIDSVNVFSRSHYLPLFSRLGAYERDRLDRLVLRPRTRRSTPEYVEYLAHEATFLPLSDWPLWRFRMDAMRARHGGAGSWFAANAGTVAWVRSELASRGPLRPAEIERDAETARRGPWWGWDDVKRALELLWRFGEVAIAGRSGFERRYALADQVVPAEHREREVGADEAVRELVRRAARAYGVATAADLADYHRLRDRRAVLAAVADLVDDGEIVPVTVRGWERAGRPIPAWRHRDAALPRRIDRATVLTPFDPVVWFRDRAERMFGFDYRIEIYTPAAQRRFGYYSLPLLVGERIVGRFDLKADRAASSLLVQSAWWERGAAAGDVAERAAGALLEAASWQGLETISVSRWGDAADDVAHVLGASRHAHPRVLGGAPH